MKLGAHHSTASASRRKKSKLREKIQRLNAEFADAQGVSLDDEGFVVVATPSNRMTRRQALIHAAHLILISDPSPEGLEFIEVMAKVATIYH